MAEPVRQPPGGSPLEFKLDWLVVQMGEIRAWQHEHDRLHGTSLRELEHRLTKLESGLSVRTWVGGGLAALAAAAGMLVRPPGSQ